MSKHLQAVQKIVIFGALAQSLFWLWTLQALRNGLLPFDLVFFWLTLPAALLGFLGLSIPLAAGLAAAGLAIDIGLLVALLNAG